MRTYELTFVLDARLPEEQVEAQREEYRQMIEAAGGRIEHVEDWGKRRMAYPIRKLQDGRYVLFHISCDNGSPTVEVEHRMGQNENVLRYLTVRTEAIAFDPERIRAVVEEVATAPAAPVAEAAPVAPAAEPAPAEPTAESAPAAPAAEPEASAPLAEVSEARAEAPAPEEEAAAPEPEAPAPEVEIAAPGPEAPAPEVEAAAPEPEASAPEAEEPAPDAEASAPTAEAPVPVEEAPEVESATEPAAEADDEAEDEETKA